MPSPKRFLVRAVRCVLDVLEKGAPYAGFGFVSVQPQTGAPAEAPLPAPPPAVPDRRSTAPLTEVELALWDDLSRRDRPRWYRRFAGTGGSTGGRR